jgi:beta-phosphoglucomutase-like phosphatase (HAD superfamily)
MEFITFMANYGLPGVVIGLLCLWIFVKDKQAQTRQKEFDAQLDEAHEQLRAEQTQRVEDAKVYAKASMDLQAEVIQGVNSLEASTEQQTKLCSTVEKFIDAVEKIVGRVQIRR